MSPLEVAIDDSNLFRTCIGQVLQCFGAHLASADEQNAFVIESLEKLRGNLAHRYTWDADATTVDLGLR